MKERIFLQNNIERIQIEEYLRKEFAQAKCGEIELQHTPVGTRIIIHTVMPGLVIGTGGSKIKELIENIKSTFHIENPQIDVQKIENQDMNPSIVAQNIAEAVENGVQYKRLGNQYIARILAAGAIGVEIVFAGKFSGARARVERFKAGYLKKCGFPSKTHVRTGFAEALPKLGITGITVKIMVKKLPDIVDISKFPHKEPEKETKENKDEAGPKKSLRKKKEAKEDKNKIKKEKEVNEVVDQTENIIENEKGIKDDADGNNA